ncbi:MAG TPA: S41 family peptidase [Candidatus Binataceae bacterium]|nr:S41 family peptidase [Candidatus Binataceae bacterium]
MNNQGYYNNPAISRDTVYFVTEDDLWCVPSAGGTARRLTSGLGAAEFPAVSPDGSLLAFTSSEEGSSDVYVMAADGGPARRLSFEGKLCRVVGWTPAHHQLPNYIVYTSAAEQPFGTHPFAGQHLRMVSLDYGDSIAINLGPAEYLSFSPDGRAAVLARGAVDAAHWKRYRGGTAGDLWIDPEGGGQWRRLIKLNGNLSRPLWLGSRIYFISDHEGIGNVYSCTVSGEDLRRHTGHADFFARNAATDGRRIVYQVGGDLFLLDPPSGREAVKIEIELKSPRTQRNRKFINAARYLESYAPHPTSESLAITSRGKIAMFGVWEGPTRQIGEPASGRRRLARWTHDGKHLISAYDAEGDEVLELRSVDDLSEAKVLRGPEIARVVALKASPCRDRAAFTNVRNELVLADFDAGSMRVVDRNRHSPDVSFNFSPDGRYLAYDWCPDRRTAIIRIHRLEDSATFNVTRAVKVDFAPVFDPDGEYLFFIGAREFNPVFDNLHFELGFPKGMRPFVIGLRKDVPTPLGRKFEPKKNDASDSARDTLIDFDGIEDRIETVPMPEGIYAQLEPLRGGKLLVTSLPVEGSLDIPMLNPRDEPEAKAKLEMFDFETRKLETWIEGVTSFALSRDRERLIYRAGSRLRMLKTAQKPDAQSANEEPGAKSGWIDLRRVRISIDPASEWRQMYREAWRLQRDQYWVEDMAEVDWKAVFDQYLPLVERVGTRGEFEDLLWEMQGELGASHAYASGGDHRRPPQYRMGFLGASFIWDETSSCWRITRIVRGDPADSRSPPPLARLGVNVSEGSVILAINNQPVTRDASPAQLLVHQSNTEVLLTVADTPGAAVRQVVVKAAVDDTLIRYREWVERNRAWVHERSAERCGYVHIPDMGPWGYAEFHRLFLVELHRDGLVIDVRFNRGGNVSTLLLEKLTRRRLGYTRSRWLETEPEPYDTAAGPMVALTNQYAGSDGDIFSHNFKRLKLGPLIGKRTWGGVIGIWPRHLLADKGMTTQPEFAWWFDDAGWGIENRGTEPDIEVEYPPQDYLSGRDPQLERALAELIKLLPEKPSTSPLDPRPSRAFRR